MAHVWLRLADNYDDVILPAATEQARPVVQQQQQIQPKHIRLHSDEDAIAATR